MKKKTFALMMAIGMLFTAACSNQTQAPAPKTEEPVEETPVEETPVETEDNAIEEVQEEPTEVEEEEEDVKGASAGYAIPPEFYSRFDNRYETADDNSTVLFKGSYETLQLTEDMAELYPDLNTAITAEAAEKEAWFDQTANNMLSDFKELIEENPDMINGDRDDWNTYESSIVIERCDEWVTAYYESWNAFSGGAHGMYGCEGVNFDSQTGKKLLLTDILKDTSNLKEILVEKLQEAYPEPDYFADDLNVLLASYDPTVTESTPVDDSGEEYVYPYDYVLTNDGLNFYFGPYALAPYAMGAQEVTLGYEEYSDLFKDDYLPMYDTPVLRNFGQYSPLYDLNGDGTKDEIGVTYAYNDDYSEVTGLNASITIDGKESTAFVESDWLDPSFDLTGYYMHLRDGRQYIYAVAELMDDSNELYVFDLNGGDVKAVSELSFTKPLVDFGEDMYGIYKWVHPDHLVLGNRFDMMSTFNASRVYFVGSDGMPDTYQEFYYVLTDAAYEPLEAKTDIACEFLDEAGDVVEEDAVIHAGDNLWNYRTNGDEIFDVRLRDGTIARLHVEDGEESRQINGVDINELVVMTYYAG